MYGLDLFSGIGGITKALEGYVRPVAYCENDRYAQGILLSRMADGQLPLAPVWDDITTFNGGLIPPIQIIYGGFPCQDISVAGRGGGLDGKRSRLFFEIARLVSEIRPRFVFLENVPAIRLRGGNIIVGTLANLGYNCRWDTLSAADVGANHRRERWWLLAYSNRPDGRIQSESGRCSKTIPFDDGTKEFVADPDITRRTESGGAWARWSKPSNGGWWATEPNVGRVANGIPFRVDRLRGLGNSVVPTQAREAFERLSGIRGRLI